MERAYLDHNATSPLRPEARAAMLEALSLAGNPSSVHAEGRAARALVERARGQVAGLVGGRADAVTFTSGGSEANTTVLTPQWSREGTPIPRAHLVVSAVEHPSVLAGGRFAPEAIHVAAVDTAGRINLDRLDDLLGRLDGPALVSVMAANNETGVVQPVAAAAAVARDHEAIVHCDAVQVAGRLPLDIENLGVDALTLSAHKFGGPRGAGAVVRRAGAPDFAALVTGGGREDRKRAGTENAVAIAGFGAVAALRDPDDGRQAAWRRLLDEVREIVGPRAVEFGAGAERLPQTLCFGLPDLGAETLVIALDLAGIAVSSGAACSSGKVGPSHVLAAMGVAPDLARTAIRVSLGWDSDEKDIDFLAKRWPDVINNVG